MKTFFLLSPLLWFRKLIVYLLAIVILLGVVVYFVANAPWVIQKAAENFAPDYNISYTRIHGNVLTGVEIEDLAYNKKPLSKHVSLKWNPNALLKKEIMVNHLVLEKVNVDTIKDLVNAFPSDDNSSSEPFSFGVKVKKLAIDIDPFVESNITVKNIIVNAENIYYKNDALALGALGLVVDTNITKLILKASLKNGIVDVKELEIQDLNTLALQALVLSDEKANEPDVVMETSSTEIATKSNPLIQTKINVHTLHANILPVKYDPVTIERLDIEAQEAVFDIDTLMLEKGHLSFSAKTNLASVENQGDIVNNQLQSKVIFTPTETLFTQYDIPVRRESVGNIEVQLDANKDHIIAVLDTKMSQLLKAKKDAFNLDVDSLKSTVTYSLEEGRLDAKSEAFISTPYAKHIQVTNLFTLEDTISYRGDVTIKQMIGVDAKLVQPLNDLHLTYSGDEKSIDTQIVSEMLKGSFTSSDFKTASLHIESKKALMLRDFVSLPQELNETKASLTIDAPLDFDANASYIAYAKVRSNVANINVNVSYKDTLHLSSTIDIDKDSLLRPMAEAVKWDNIMPIKVDADLLEESLEAKVDAGQINAKVSYTLNSTDVKGNINLSGLKATISGIAQKQLHITSNVSSIPSLLKSVSSVYTLDELPKVEGSAKVSVDIDALKKVDLAVKAPLLVYHTGSKTATNINDVDILVHYEEDKVVLKHYSVVYEKEKIYATKPSMIMFHEDNITVSPLWVNDQLKAQGHYDLKTKKGKVLIGADNLHLSHEIIDLDTNIDITTLLDGNKTNIKGKVILLGGDVHYDMSQKTFASDSDIIIVQDMKEDKESPFMDNLSVELQVKTKKPLVYNTDVMHMKANVDVTVHKAEGSELLVLGSVEPVNGSTYLFQNKKFVLDKSAVYFTGNPNKPLLDIKVNYKALEYLVTITITGSADLPNIAFSSKPSLNREQILSLILFDSVEAAGTNSGDQMMKMMGGAMAKSALNDIGIQVDHLVLGEGNSVEVGKKLTKNITIIYVNGDVAEVKLKYEHSKHTESVIGASERSQSYDIIYKKDF